MNTRTITALLALFIISVVALGTAFAAVSYYKSQQAAATVNTAVPEETAENKQSKQQQQQLQEISWSAEEPQPVEPPKPKNTSLKETHYKLAIKPESLTTPEILTEYIGKMEAELTDQRQKCDDRKAIIDLRYNQQDITAQQYTKDIAKIDFYKEQYTLSVLQNIITLIEKSPCLTAEEKPNWAQNYKTRLIEASQRSQQAKTIYERN